MIFLLMLVFGTILAIWLGCYFSLRSEWHKPDEYGAAITFKEFHALYKIHPEKWYLYRSQAAYRDNDGFMRDVNFVTFKEYKKYYKWYKDYTKEQAIEKTLNNTQKLRKEWDEDMRQEKKELSQQIDYYEKILSELKEKYGVNF